MSSIQSSLSLMASEWCVSVMIHMYMVRNCVIALVSMFSLLLVLSSKGSSMSGIDCVILRWLGLVLKEPYLHTEESV